MESCNTPKPLEFHTGNISEKWRLWKQKFELYLLASGKCGKTDEVKIAILLNLLGDEAIQIYNTFEFESTEDKKKLETIIAKFEAYCNPLKNLVFEHYKFFKRDQLPDETLDQFLVALRQLASTCEFKEKDVLILDRIVLGIYDLKIQEKLLQYSNLNLQTAVAICRSMENSAITQKQIVSLSQQTVNVNALKKINTFHRNDNLPRHVCNTCNEASTSAQEGFKNRKGKFSSACNKCGSNHPRGQCPAFNKICSLCHKYGHYRKFCQSKNVHEISQNSPNTSAQSDIDNYSDSDDTLLTWSVTENICSIEWVEKIKISNVLVSVKIDTGSSVNILNLTDFYSLKINFKELSHVPSKLMSYSGHMLDILGKIYLECTFKNMKGQILFYILNDTSPISILGLPSCQQLNIVPDKYEKHVNVVSNSTLQDILDNNITVFSGIGKVREKCSITLCNDAVPHVSSCRKIPIALKSKVKDKLDKMVSENIILPVSEPTDWVNPIVVVPKSNGDIRICMDPRNLNKYVKRELFQIPTYDTLFAELGGAKYFTLLDASSAFLQIPLTYESSLLCTVITPFGRYRYLRLPYGLTSAPEVFQRFIYNLIGDLPKVICYFDDILVFGQTLEEHNVNLNRVLGKIKNSGLTLNLEKSKFCVSEIKFLGHIISSKGISPDPDKTQAISNMTSPKNKKDLQRFLGMIVYLSKFIPNLSQKTSPLRMLLSEKVEWQWTVNEENSFQQIKESVSSTTTLSYFDVNKKVVLAVDASPFGMGAVILQDNKPIEFASVSLTPTQQKYNHIEKELLAIVFGCERFHYYLYGNNFEIHSDHRPLIGLLKKPLDDLSPRLQRLSIRLLRYRFDLVYVPGKDMKIPDTLSRDPSGDVYNTKYLESNLQVFAVISTSKENAARLENEIDQDPTLQKVKYYAIHGWPLHKSNVPCSVKKYWSIRNEIFLHKNVLFFKKRILIPESLKQEFLDLIHQSHQGVVSCKKKAQETIYYPGILADIEKFVLSCTTCQMYSKSNQKEPLIPHQLPSYPWQKIGIDFLYIGGADFLVIVDYYSKFTIVNKLSSKTASSVITALKNVFVLYGLPQEIFSDNGPPYDSQEFKNFAKQYFIDLSTSSPRYAQSNGMIERTIQTVKGLFVKAIKNREDPFMTILSYNTTPKQNLPAPCLLLMGRYLRTNLPVSSDLLKPEYSTKGIKVELKNNQTKQKFYYNKNAKKRQNFKEGQDVLVQQRTREWKPGVIVSKNNPNDFIVRINDTDYRRNKHFLRPFCKCSNNDSKKSETINDSKNLGNLKDNLNLNVDIESETIFDNENRNVSLQNGFKMEPESNQNLITTRSGRTVKPPSRLDL